MRQRLLRVPCYPEYIANAEVSRFTNTTNFHSMSDRKLMERFCHEHLYATMSTEFVRICAELGSRGYDPDYNKIRAALS